MNTYCLIHIDMNEYCILTYTLSAQLRKDLVIR